MHFKLLSSILRGVWAIEPSIAESYWPQLVLLFEGRPVIEDESPNRLKAALLNADNYYSWEAALIKADPGSIAVIPFSGPIMKEDSCGAAGTATRMNQIKQAANNPNIDAIILQIDSPGGEVSGTQQLAAAIKSITNKPVLTYVEDMMCSAALWIGTSANEVWASTKNDIVGSIGTMINFADMRKALDARGIKMHEVYADASKDKNGVFKAAMDGDYKPIKEQLLNPLNDAFVSAVKANRAGKYDARSENIFTGKTYMAGDAINNGLVDNIGTFEDVVERARQLAKQQAKAQTQNSQINANSQPMKIKAAWTAIVASLKKIGVEATEETEITAEYAEHMNKDLAETTAALATANTELETAKAKVTELTNDAVVKADEIAALKAQVAELEKTPAIKTPAAAKTADTDGSEDAFADAEYNKRADELTGRK